MLRHVALQNLAAFVLYDKEAVQHSKHHRRHGEETQCGDYLAVILGESRTTVAWGRRGEPSGANIWPRSVPRR
jgi:hypothetical protein